MIALSKARMLAPDGRCKTFDAAADGYVRGEGCGVVLLKRLSDALADGDAIRAVIRGSAINQDGRSNGITAPNLQAQKAVLQEAVANAHYRSVPRVVDRGAWHRHLVGRSYRDRGAAVGLRRAGLPRLVCSAPLRQTSGIWKARRESPG
jgi:hypothetical protein